MLLESTVRTFVVDHIIAHCSHYQSCSAFLTIPVHRPWSLPGEGLSHFRRGYVGLGTRAFSNGSRDSHR